MHSTTHQEEMIVPSFIEKNRMVTPPKKKSLCMQGEMETDSSTINTKTVSTILKKMRV